MDYKEKFDKVLEHLKQELGGFRTGRATPSLVEQLKIPAYDGAEPMPLAQLATISVPEPRQLMIEPWDKSVLKAIEQAVSQTDFGFSVGIEGGLLRLTIPVMTDEVRRQIVRMLNQKMEEAKISLRGHRDKIKEEISQQEKAKEISEDEKYNLIEELDEAVKEFTEKIKEIGSNKEKEIAI